MAKTTIKLNQNICERALRVAKAVGYSSLEEFVEHAVEKELAIHEETYNTLALLADLHTGKSTGNAWPFIIYSTAILLFFASVSGLILWISLKKRRTIGLVALAVSVAICIAFYVWLVP